MILQFLFIQLTQGIITQTAGAFNEFVWNAPGFLCQNGFTKTGNINFQDSFANIPKIIIVPNVLDITPVFTNQIIVQIDIVSVTLTGFSIKITCPNNKVGTYQMRWFAIDDSRIEVINELNLNPIASKQYPIQNPNIKKAIVSILNFGYNGPFDVGLSVSELTSTHVTVNVNSANSNLIYLGYQVILGTEEVISYIDKVSSTSIYTSQIYPLQSNSYFVISFNNLGLNDADTLKLGVSISSTSTTINYQTQIWGPGTYAPNTLQSYWLKFNINQAYMAMECFTIRINKIFYRNSDQRPAFQLDIQEINQVFNTIGSDSIIVNESITLLNIHVYYKCPSNNKKVHSQMNKCNSCTGNNKIYNLNHYCHGSINSINIYAKYNAQSNNKELTITRTTNGITIIQTLRNKSTTQQEILLVEFLDI
ncbi:unnamed protein product [Paramecium primaurelia]|uniref:H-type lectin domain-containing protein n=1 Tax=Paramecium primaurelia TaxID=5886 RepID=A0A8S1KEH2_PARPR|nr:unnamed protein product [Paramecium primaurelia]